MARRSTKLAVVCLVAAVLFGGGAVAGVLVTRSVTLSDANSQTCKAVRRNNDILRDLLAHVEHRSLVSIREGVTRDISAEAVRSFYDPTLRRIDAVHC
jgi:hypothetical protein